MVAKNIYKIAYDEKTLRLDKKKTEDVRSDAKKERLNLGKPYEEFETEWLKLRPSDEALKYYGSYPNPSEGPPPGPPGM